MLLNIEQLHHDCLNIKTLHHVMCCRKTLDPLRIINISRPFTLSAVVTLLTHGINF